MEWKGNGFCTAQIQILGLPALGSELALGIRGVLPCIECILLVDCVCACVCVCVAMQLFGLSLGAYKYKKNIPKALYSLGPSVNISL